MKVPPDERRWSFGVVGLVAGAGVVGFVQGLLELAAPESGMPRELLILGVCGNLLAAMLAVPFVWLLARVRRPALPPRQASCFWMGWGLGLLPFGASVLPDTSVWLAILPGAVFLIAAPLLGERLSVPFGLQRGALIFLAFTWPLAHLVFGEPVKAGEGESEDVARARVQAMVEGVESRTWYGWIVPHGMQHRVLLVGLPPGPWKSYLPEAGE